MNTNKQTNIANNFKSIANQTKTECTCIPQNTQFFPFQQNKHTQKLIEYLNHILFPWDRTVAYDDDCVCVVHIYLFICIII